METRAFPDPSPGAIVRHPGVSTPMDNVVPARSPTGAGGGREKSVARKPRRRTWRYLRLAPVALLVPVLVAGGVLFAWTRELPAFDGLKDYEPKVSTRVFAADGTEAF